MNYVHALYKSSLILKRGQEGCLCVWTEHWGENQAGFVLRSTGWSVEVGGCLDWGQDGGWSQTSSALHDGIKAEDAIGGSLNRDTLNVSSSCWFQRQGDWPLWLVDGGYQGCWLHDLDLDKFCFLVCLHGWRVSIWSSLLFLHLAAANLFLSLLILLFSSSSGSRRGSSSLFLLLLLVSTTLTLLMFMTLDPTTLGTHCSSARMMSPLFSSVGDTMVADPPPHRA